MELISRSGTAFVLMREPGRSFPDCLKRSEPVSPINLARAQQQHRALANVYRELGLDVKILPPLDDAPDSVFVEDVAVVIEGRALVLHPGAKGRSPEADHIEGPLSLVADVVGRIESMDADGGDVLVTDRHVFVGVNARTDPRLVSVLSPIAGRREVLAIDMANLDALHLKSVATWVGRSTLVVSTELSDIPEFKHYEKLVVDKAEKRGANCQWVSDVVLAPEGCPKLLSSLQARGFKVWTVDISEFEKGDGSITCLSIHSRPSP